MSTDELQRELTRIADAAPVAEVPHDIWRRARRSAVRDRVVIVAAAAAVVGVVAGGVAWLPHRDTAEPARSSAPDGVPSMIWNAPSFVASVDVDDLSYSGDVETDLAIGRGAVAYTTEKYVPVVVGADDGAYHYLALPGYLGLYNGQQPSDDVAEAFVTLQLSPDGRYLAYPYADPEGRERKADPMPTGLRIVDLETGDIRQVPLEAGMGVLVGEIAWSPSGTWLVWGGTNTTAWEWGMGMATGGRTLSGLVAPGATSSQSFDPAIGRVQQQAVSDSGEVLLAADSATARQGEGEPIVYEVEHPNQGLERPLLGAFTESGPQVLLDKASTIYGYLLRAFPDGGTPDLSNGRTVGPSGQAMVPLGWLDADHLLVRTGQLTDDNELGGSEGTADLTELAILDLRSSELTTVGAFEKGVPTVSIATDLIGVDRPTVDRPEPDWPFEWTDARLALAVGLGVAGFLSVWIGLERLWGRRYRRRNS